MHIQNLEKFCGFVIYVFRGHEILAYIKGHNSGINVRKIMCNNLNLDLVNMNSYTKFGEILSICSQDIEWKQNIGVNEGQEFWYKPAKNDR